MGVKFKDAFGAVSNIPPRGMSDVYYKDGIGAISRILGGGEPPAALRLSDFPTGALIKFRVGGIYRHYILVHHGRPSTLYDAIFTNTSVLMMRQLPSAMAWNSVNTNSYADSTVDAYLHDTYKNLIEEPIRDRLVTVKIPYRAGTGSSTTITSGANGLPVQVFLASAIELGHATQSYMPLDGAKFGYFISGDTTEAREQRRAVDFGGTYRAYWTRTPYAAINPISAWTNHTTGTAVNQTVINTSPYIRPCVVFHNSTGVSAIPDADGAYTLLPTGEIPATGIILSGTQASIRVNSVFTPVATLTPDNTTDTVTWTATGGYVTITPETGLSPTIRGAKVGMSTVTAKTTSGLTTGFLVQVQT